jgi:hypothetical protein
MGQVKEHEAFALGADELSEELISKCRVPVHKAEYLEIKYGAGNGARRMVLPGAPAKYVFFVWFAWTNGDKLFVRVYQDLHVTYIRHGLKARTIEFNHFPCKEERWIIREGKELPSRNLKSGKTYADLGDPGLRGCDG